MYYIQFVKTSARLCKWRQLKDVGQILVENDTLNFLESVLA